MAEVSNNDLVQTEEEYEDDDDDDVFDIMLNPGGDEGSSFRTRNDPSAPYQRTNVTERKGALDIRCTCLDVIHGLVSPDAEEFATIIVLNFRFDSRKTARRILAVNITLQFAPEQPGGGVWHEGVRRTHVIGAGGVGTGAFLVTLVTLEGFWPSRKDLWERGQRIVVTY